MAPHRDDLLALAERALRACAAPRRRRRGGSVSWARRPAAPWPPRRCRSRSRCCARGGVGTAVTTDVDHDGLRRALDAPGGWRRPVPRRSQLPEPTPGRPHDGYDGVGTWRAARGRGAASGRAAAARTAIVSTRGVRAYEERSFGELRVRRHGAPGRSLELSVTAVRAADLDTEALGDEAGPLLGGGEPGAVDAGEYAVVLGPWAMAEVLRRVALSFGGPGRRAPSASRSASRRPRSTSRTRPGSRRRCRAPTMPRAPAAAVTADPGRGRAPGGRGRDRPRTGRGRRRRVPARAPRARGRWRRRASASSRRRSSAGSSSPRCRCTARGWPGGAARRSPRESA